MGKAAVTRIARSVMMRGLEKKQRSFSLWVNKQIYGGGLSLPGTLQNEYGAIIPNVPVLFSVSQGTNSQSRIGKHLNNCRCVVSGYIKSNVFNADYNPDYGPFEVCMIIYRKFDDYLSNNPNEIKDGRTNAYVPINSTVQNDMLPYNRDSYKFYKIRRWRLKPQPIPVVHAVPAPTGSTTNQIETINPETGSSLNPMMVRFRQELPMPKTLKYDESSPYAPQNSSFALAMFLINCDGTTPTPTQHRASVWLDANLTWTD